MTPTLSRLLVVVLCAAACVGQFQDGCMVTLKNKRPEEAKAVYMSVCDGCVITGYTSTVFSATTVTSQAEYFAIKNIKHGVIALQASNGRFLRRCPTCMTGKYKDGTWVADSLSFADVTTHLTVHELGPSTYALQADNDRFVTRCYLCYIDNPLSVGVVNELSATQIDVGLEIEIISCPFCYTGFEVAVSGAVMQPVQVASKEEVVKVLPKIDVHDIPESFRSGFVIVPPLPVSTGSVIELRCCGNADCHFFVSVYRCRTCRAAYFNGGLPSSLLAMEAEFDAASCAPTFSIRADATGAKYPMATFHTTVTKRTTVILPALTTDARVLAIFATTTPPTGPWCPRRNIGPVQAASCPCMA
ncbi:hypothetical protein DIPPA_20238 [Diplonema papillatum]|nr:hypothetical protein DIPPA_20238 [Diplonema papillatum]